MIKEIYCRLPIDTNYKKVIECPNEEEEILQQIRVILGTKPGQVLGAPGFGINLEDYLFSFTFNQDEVQSLLTSLINTYLDLDTNKYSVKVKVNYGKDHYNKSDYAVIDIIINQEKTMGILVT